MTARAKHPIELAIERTQRYMNQLDVRAMRASRRAGRAQTEEDRDRAITELNSISQMRDAAAFLLNGLKAVRHRPEVAAMGAQRRTLTRMLPARRPAPERKLA